MFSGRSRCTLLHKWTLPTSKRGAADLDKTIKWGRISARGSGSAYDQGVDTHVMGKGRSVNRAAPRGLLRGFANEEQPPALPSTSTKK